MGNKHLDLYHPKILELDKNPYHFEKLEEDPFLVASNPLCGDRFKIFRKSLMDSSEYAFYGHGCAVSKASTSLLVKALETFSMEEVRVMAESFVTFIESDQGAVCPTDDLNIFSQVKSHPSRLECATLPWKSLLQKLRENRK